MNVRTYHAIFPVSCILATAFNFGGYAAAASDGDARVTRIIREVNILPYKADPKLANLNDRVGEGTGVRTGNESRSELTFVDLTITRLGANSLFSFNKAGRNVELGGGSLLLRVPKNSGGAHINASAVTVGVTGTTLILESSRRSKLIVLEGAARIALRRFPMKSASVRGGQMIDVPPGATELPPVVNINVNDVMKTHPLITDFPPLPTRDAIYAGQPAPPPQAQPAGGGSGGGVSVNVPVIGPIVGSIPLGPGRVSKTPKPGRDGTGTRGEGTTSDGTVTRGEGTTSDGVSTGSQGSNSKTGGTINNTGASGSKGSKPNYTVNAAGQTIARQTGKARPTPTPPPRRRVVPKRHGL
jgi:FecR protein